MRTKRMLGITVAVVIVVTALAIHQGGMNTGKAAAATVGKPLPLVSLIEARTLDLPIRFSAQGHLVPLNSVDVRPQVTGTIRSVDFREGDDIKAGQLLFTLDASDRIAQLNRVEAQAANIQAQLDDARRDHNRSKELAAKGYFSSSAVDTTASKVDSFEAQLKAAKADVASARVQVGYTRIVAPISAKAGAVNVHSGSLAQQGDALPLVSLLQFDPIGAEFTLPEQNLGALLTARAIGQTAISVETLDGEKIGGDLVFINNTVNTSTGTINLKASFPNAQQRLWPGAFVRLSLSAGVDKDAIVLPPQAVLEGPDGHFVFQLDEHGKVGSRAVTLLRMQDQSAVVEGLKSGEQVVVEGNQNLRAGMTASIAGTQRTPPGDATREIRR